MTIRTEYRTITGPCFSRPNPLHEEIRKLEPLAATGQLPITWERAEDFSVWDDQGNRWIDMTSGIFVTNAGHNNPRIKEAIHRHLDQSLVFSYNYPTRVKRDFLRKLLELSPSYFDRVDLLITGSETVDCAYKLIKFWSRRHGRKYIVTFAGNYHGRGLSNDFISGNKSKASWSGLADSDVVFLDFPFEPGTRFSPEGLPPKEQIAAFFFETFQGWGAWFYPDQFLNDAYVYAREAGALVGFDEMQAGFYRLGPIFGYMTYGDHIKPDLICVGKGITSSLPLAAILTRDEIVNIDTSADLHGTHSGNTLCCAAALANIEFLSDPAFQTRLKERSACFEDGMRSLESLPGVTRVNTRGMIAGVIFASEDLATSAVYHCVQRGVLPVWTHRPSIKFAPPLTTPIPALQEAVAVIREAILAAGRGEPLNG